MSEIPGDLKFLKSHEWARVEDDGKVARCAFVALFDDGLIEYPGMSLLEGAFGGCGDTQRNALSGWAWELRKCGEGFSH